MEVNHLCSLFVGLRISVFFIAMTKLCQLERSFKELIRLEGGEDDVGEPQKEEDSGRDVFEELVSPQLCSLTAVSESWNKPSNEDECDRDGGTEDVDRDREGQGACLDRERAPLKKKINVLCGKKLSQLD